MTSLLTLGALSALAVPGSERYVALAALLALLVGAIRVLMGSVRAGYVAYLLSQPVITGFTTGAAVVIVASQIPSLLDVSVGAGNPLVTAVEALRQPASWQIGSILIGVGVAAIMLGGRLIHRLFPGVLVAVIAATAYSAMSDFAGSTVGEVASGFPPFSLVFPWDSALSLLVPALVIAIVGFSEPASIARYYATIERKRWDPDRELVSQGVANLAAAFGGGFPAGGSFSRSALVREAGAKTKWAGGITGLVVLLMLPFMGLLSALPIAALAAGIIVAVRDLISIKPFKEYRTYARLQFYVAVITFVATLITAPHVERGVLVGIGVAIAAHLWRELRLSIPAWVSNSDTLHLAPKGVLYFASAPGLEHAFGKLLNEHPEANKLIVHLNGLGRVDLTGALALRGLLKDAVEAGLVAKIEDIPPQARKVVERVIPASFR